MMKWIKKIREHKHLLRFVLMFVCVYFLLAHIWEFNNLMEYEEIPSYVNVYNSEEKIEEYSQLQDFTLEFNLSYPLYNEENLLNDSNYNIENNIYRVEHDQDTKRDLVLLNIMFDLFLISLLWHTKIKDEEKD